MTTALDRYRDASQRRLRRAERANHRLDIQGLRGIAVLAVLAYHLWGLPGAGFVGIDVFLVLAGFFAARTLLDSAAAEGPGFLRVFYAERARRIIPAAALVLILTLAASELLFSADRAESVGADTVFAFLFLANWHFADHAPAAAEASGALSPLLHFWALSIEEQFLFVFPLIVLLITLVAMRARWSEQRFTGAAVVVVGLATAASLGWAFYLADTSPAAAYYSTFARIWELGAGALLAAAAAALTRLPDWIRPLLSWAGVGLVVASAFALGGTDFPAPWALLPVTGTLLVIAAGVGREPNFQPLLRNRAFTYVGDISYSLYLVHWPAIVLLAAVMNPTIYYDAATLALTFGLAIALHHFVDTPLRHARPRAIRQVRRDMRHGLFHVERATKVAGVAALVLITVSLIAYAARPDAYHAAPQQGCCAPAPAGPLPPQR
ncbi:acyltransferase family protein [Mycolicibacterium vaccae]|uniref:acyltransferase family protein n=1 Tax=Mycolicibacterium vaccae TaxID=1810 RepID=UPI003D02B1A8